MNKPFLTPDNVLQYQSEGRGWSFDKCLELHMEINSYINHLCDNDNFDGGGEYALWLNRLGFSHQTDEGWWNKTAVDLKNMELFSEWYKWDPDVPNNKMEVIKARINTGLELSKHKGLRLNLLDHHCVVESYLGLEEQQ